MVYYRIIKGTKWYYRLKPSQQDGKISEGLFSDQDRHALRNSLIVSWSYHDIKANKTYRLYTCFKSYLEYGIFQMKLPEHERCFYEIILGEAPQKPHFDIDIKVDTNTPANLGELVKDNLIDNIVKILSDKNTIIDIAKDILVFTSHGANKQSYHIIINNHCHANNVEARSFYDNLMDAVNPDYVQWIDRAVYSPTQQFRIVGSRKIGSDRIKLFNKKWKYHENDIYYEYPDEPDSPDFEFVMQLEASIVGYTGNCQMLPAFDPKPETIKNYTDTDDVSRHDAEDAINLIALAGNINVTDNRFPYKFLNISGPIVMLKRIRPSICKICKRKHDNENPYLLVIGEEKSVYFFCRRGPQDSKLFLGQLNPLPKAEKESPPSPEHEKLSEVKINWTHNVLERVNEIAKANTRDTKKYITKETQIDPAYKKQLIDVYINYK